MHQGQLQHAAVRGACKRVALTCCAGDAGAIGRVVCNPAGADTAAAVARVASRLRNKQPQAHKGSKAAAGDIDDDAGSDPLSEGSDMADDSHSDSQGSDGSAGLDSDEKQPAGLPALDLKGMVMLAAGR